MRYDGDHKQATRARVLSEAARTLRAEGPDKLGVAEVMGRAGLTHGGFYAHFRSKDDLLAEALEASFADAGRMFDAAIKGREPRAALAAYVRGYLSMAHRNGRDRGCPLAALAGDTPRMNGDLRTRYAAGAQRLIERLRRLMVDAAVPESATIAPSVAAELVGALVLARATPDAAEARDIIRASRTSVGERLGLEDVS